MLHFTLANFYNGFSVNKLFLELVYKYGGQSDILKDNVVFNQISGSFPFNSWNGSVNSCLVPELALNSQIVDCFNQNSLSLRLNFANMFLEDTDFFNTYNKVVLEKGDNGATVIELCNLKLYEYIKEHYPKYNKYVLSPNASILVGDEFTPEMLNVILDNPDFQLVSLPGQYATEEFLKQIKHKNKIEICVNPMCSPKCKYLNECILNENKLQYLFSQNSVLGNCPRRYRYNNNPNIIEIADLHKFTQMGITHFRLETCVPNELNEYFLFLVKYFIKPEYQQRILEEGYLAITSHQ
jgi:hypothetical protein